MLIETETLTRQSLTRQVAIVTGAGRGIGFDAARALIWLGAQVVLTEIAENSGREAAHCLTTEFGKGRAAFIRTDVGSEPGVHRLKHRVLECFGKADIVINNATITPMGAVRDVPIGRRDASYGVNLRGPVLLAQSFLPGTLERDHGVFVCVSSVSEAYMRAYEALKAAQVHLGSTLDAELEGTGVHVLTIDPGLVRTPGLQAAAEALARSMGRRWRNSTR